MVQTRQGTMKSASSLGRTFSRVPMSMSSFAHTSHQADKQGGGGVGGGRQGRRPRRLPIDEYSLKTRLKKAFSFDPSEFSRLIHQQQQLNQGITPCSSKQNLLDAERLDAVERRIRQWDQSREGGDAGDDVKAKLNDEAEGFQSLFSNADKMMRKTNFLMTTLRAPGKMIPHPDMFGELEKQNYVMNDGDGTDLHRQGGGGGRRSLFRSESAPGRPGGGMNKSRLRFYAYHRVWDPQLFDEMEGLEEAGKDRTIGLEPRLRSPDLVDSGDEAPVLLGDRLVSAAVFRKYQAAVRQMERAAKDLADAPKKEKLKKLQEQGAARTCRTMTAWRRKEEFLAEEAEKVKSESIRKQLAWIETQREREKERLMLPYKNMLTAIVTALLFQRFVTTVRHGPPPLFSDLTHDVLEMKYARLLGKTVSSIPRMGRKPQQRSVPVLPAASAGKGSPRGSLSSSQGARASFARRRRPSWFLYGFDLNKDLSAVDSKALQQREGIDRLFHSIGKIRRMPIETDNSDSVREPPLPVLPSLQSGVGPGPSAALSRGSVSEAKLQPQQPSGTPAGIAPGQALSSARRSSNFLVQYLQAEASQRVGATGASKDGSAGAGGGRRGTRRGSQNRKEGGGAQGSTGGPTAVGGGRKASAAMGSSGTSAKPGGGR